jgi:hypothetical protein
MSEPPAGIPEADWLSWPPDARQFRAQLTALASELVAAAREMRRRRWLQIALVHMAGEDPGGQAWLVIDRAYRLRLRVFIPSQPLHQRMGLWSPVNLSLVTARSDTTLP